MVKGKGRGVVGKRRGGTEERGKGSAFPPFPNSPLLLPASLCNSRKLYRRRKIRTTWLLISSKTTWRELHAKERKARRFAWCLRHRKCIWTTYHHTLLLPPPSLHLLRRLHRWQFYNVENRELYFHGPLWWTRSHIGPEKEYDKIKHVQFRCGENMRYFERHSFSSSDSSK